MPTGTADVNAAPFAPQGVEGPACLSWAIFCRGESLCHRLTGQPALDEARQGFTGGDFLRAALVGERPSGK